MIEKYKLYLDKIDKYLQNFFENQKPYIHCKEGCSFCCESGNYPIFEAEFLYLIQGFESLNEEKKQIVKEKIKNLKSNKKSLYECPFLINKKCSVYNYRPLICRSYGLANFSFQEEKPSLNLPYCVDLGLNYSSVYDKTSGTICSKKWKQTGIETEPLSFNIGQEFLSDNEMTRELNLNLGKSQAMIDWF